MTRAAWLRAARLLLGAALAGAAIWLLAREARRNWAQIEDFRLVFSAPHLALGFGLAVASFLCETRAFQRALNGHLGRDELSFVESVSVVNTSAVLKYVPGRVWTYGAQVLWLGRRGISGTLVVYVNVVLLLATTLTSSLLGGGYLVMYVVPPRFAVVAWPLLLVLYGAGIFLGPSLIEVGLAVLRRITRRELLAVPSPKKLLGEIAAIYALSWAFIGAAAYYCGIGVGLTITPNDVAAITASMSVSWIVGYLSALTPGGLGVREALMYVMLHRVGSARTALVLPVVSRLLYVVVEVLLGAIGLVAGFRLGVFRSDAPRAS